MLRVFICSLWLLVMRSQAQVNPDRPWQKGIARSELTYVVIEDDPNSLAKLNLNFDYLYLNLAGKNIPGTSVDLGVSGTFRFSDNLEINGLIRKAYIAFEKPSALQIDANGVLYFKNFIKRREVDVLLKYSSRTVGTYEYVTTNSLIVPDRQVLKKVGLRGGIYFRRSAFEYENFTSGNISPLTQVGFYAGIQLLNAVNVKIKMTNGAEHYNETGLIIYADLLAVGTSLGEKLIADAVKADEGIISPFGLRMGTIFKPLRPRSQSMRKNFFANTELRSEIGWRPLEGSFFQIGAGWNFYRE